MWVHSYYNGRKLDLTLEALQLRFFLILGSLKGDGLVLALHYSKYMYIPTNIYLVLLGLKVFH